MPILPVDSPPLDDLHEAAVFTPAEWVLLQWRGETMFNVSVKPTQISLKSAKN
jgi:hypothetical protein